MRLEQDEAMTKSEWVATQIGLGIVVVGGLLLEEVPRGDWGHAAVIVAGSLLTAVMIMAAVRSFSRKPEVVCVALKQEVNRNVPM